MRIEIEKKGDGASVLRCTRRDGSVTFQRHEGKQGAFFPIHDLTHLAVESELSRPEEADRVRRRLAELLGRWVALPVGDTLAVDFDR